MTDLPDMPESSYLDDTTETLLEQSQQNAQGVILATIAVLDDLGLLPEAWADGIGERFSDAWGLEEAWEPGEFLDAMLTNYRALGATVEEVSVTDAAATATIAGFPDDELCEVFHVSPESAAVFHRVAGEIARRRNLRWEWERGEETTRLIVTTRPGSE
jgi:hypothetical protein